MYLEFHARWNAASNGFVDVEVSTSRREISPVMRIHKDEEVITGVRAEALALVADGLIRYECHDGVCHTRVVSTRPPALVF